MRRGPSTVSRRYVNGISKLGQGITANRQNELRAEPNLFFAKTNSETEQAMSSMPMSPGNVRPITISAEEAWVRHEQTLDNIVTALRQRLSSTLASVVDRAFLSHVTPEGATTDVAVTREAATAPVVIIEVLSPATEGADRGQKFAHYRRLDRLAEYVMVSQERPFVEHYTRQDENRWTLRESTTLKAAPRLPSLDCELPLSEIYTGVNFPTESRLPQEVGGGASNGVPS